MSAPAKAPAGCPADWFICLSARAVIGWRNNVWLCGFPALFAPTTCFKTRLVHLMVSFCCDLSIYFSDLVLGLTALDERVVYLQNLTDCVSFDTCNIP